VGKVAEYLRSHLDGEITDASDVREHFSTDAGLSKIMPSVVVYPFNEQDVRKVARFAWQLAEKGRKVAITPRGLGSDWSGGAVGESLIVAMSTHLNKILELDSRKGLLTVEPGATIGKINQALITHGLFLPCEPLSSEFATVGGSIATDASGLRSAKYGSFAKNTISSKVVLSNGDVIQTKRLTKREANKRMGLATFEGEVYRGIDTILNENIEAIKAYTGPAEYMPLNIFDIRGKDGSVDLTPLFVGSQGTLGVVTQATLTITAFNPGLTQVVAGFFKAEEFFSVAEELKKLNPSIFTVIPKSVFQLYASLNPLFVGKKFGEILPEYVVLLEFDEFASRVQKRAQKKIKKLCSKLDVKLLFGTNEKSKEELSKLYRLPNILMQSEIEQARVVPGLDSSFVPSEHYQTAHAEIDAIFHQGTTRYVSWYDYITGVIRYFPFLDLRQLGQRQKLSRLIELVSAAVIKNGGHVGIQGGGRVSAQYHRDMCGDVLYGVMEKVKALFDPYSIMNPGVKFGVDNKSFSSKMIQGYSQGHRHNHLPK
jgi:FAD/FMN-containing dehydrogenase